MSKLKIGTILSDRFRIQQEVTKGGTTTVYRALDLETEGKVAIKAFDRDQHLPLIEQEFFRREVSALSELKHPNIVRIIANSIGTDNFPAFIVLEWIDRDLITERNNGSNSAFSGWDDYLEVLGLPILEALAFAHQRACVHRDIKPANILIDADGTPRLADFGISKLSRELLPRVTLREFTSPPFTPPEADKGYRLYSRDVFGFAAVAVWALNEQPLTDYQTLINAARCLDIPEEPRNLIISCLSDNPDLRPETALPLLHELKSLHNKRKFTWVSKSLPTITLGLSNSARKKLSICRGVSDIDRASMDAYVESDLRDTPHVAFDQPPAGKSPRPDNFVLLGGECSYIIAPSDRDDSMSIITALQNDPDSQTRRKSQSRPCPAKFRLLKTPGALLQNQAVELLNEAVSVPAAADNSPIGTLLSAWDRTLDAREAFARDVVPDILYDGIEIDGPTIALLTTSDLQNVTQQQAWTISVEKGRTIKGEVFKTSPGKIILYLQNCSPEEVPSSGTAKLDIGALRHAINRQRFAIDQIRSRTAVRADMGEILFQPKLIKPPIKIDCGSAEIVDLDQPQFRAFEAALGSDDMLLVQGPPGTGKTRFISKLITEEIRRNPRCKILLTSQTNVAIDHALSALHLSNPNLRLLRVTGRNTDRVASSSEPFQLDSLLDKWTKNVSEQSLANLKVWAQSKGFDWKKLTLGRRIRQVILCRTAQRRLRKELQLLDVEIRPLEPTQFARSRSPAPDPIFMSRQEDLRAAIDAEHTELEDHYEWFRQKFKGNDFGTKLTQLDDDGLERLLASQLGVITEEVETRLKIYDDWSRRFGRDDSFIELLCGDVNVVAATCLGLSRVETSTQLKFDLCVMDEAGKAHSTEALVPMCRAKRWVLVGDPKQLQPYEEEALRSEEYRERFEISDEAVEPMFDRLWRGAPQSSRVTLTRQYRMVAPIGSMVSKCFYDNEIENAPREIDKSLERILGSSLAWISTSDLPNRNEIRARLSYVNPCEIDCVLDLLRDCQKAFQGTERKVSVLCLSGYGAQVSALEQHLYTERSKFSNLDIECNTVDAVQGREASIVIFSIVRSNMDGLSGFLREFRRVNVALSRARDVLAIVGDHKFVAQAKDMGPLQSVLSYIRSVPVGAGVHLQCLKPMEKN